LLSNTTVWQDHRLKQIWEAEYAEIQTIIQSGKIEIKTKERAFIILDWHKGKSYDESQLLRSVSRSVIAKWRRRALNQRMSCLEDAPRSGKPVVITEGKKNKVIHLACSKASKGYSNWSQQLIGKEK
jgi:transposase